MHVFTLTPHSYRLALTQVEQVWSEDRRPRLKEDPSSAIVRRVRSVQDEQHRIRQAMLHWDMVHPVCTQCRLRSAPTGKSGTCTACEFEARHAADLDHGLD